MTATLALIKRNVKLFFKDRGMLFTSLITPAILLVLYVTFLGDVYRDSFEMNLPEGVAVSERLMSGLVGGQLVSSILSVSCVTVAFCSNFLSVQDKSNGALRDLTVSPVRSSVLSVSYFAATLISTLTICLAATVLCFGYLWIVGFYLSFGDALLLILDVLLLVLFGTALSSIINIFLSSQGQISAVGTIVSSGYGFISGAYMPISSFGDGLRTVISFLPGTYGTALVRTHSMRGALSELAGEGVPREAIEEMKSALDCNVSFFGNEVGEGAAYLVLAGSVLLLIGAYILISFLISRKKKAN